MDLTKTPDAIFDAAVAKANTPEAAPVVVDDAPKPATKTEIPVDPEMLRTVTTLQRSKRELETKLKDLETKIKSADSYSEIEKLWKEGKKLDAIAKLSGASDPIEGFQDILTDFVNAPETTAETKVTAQIKELEAKLAESDKRFADEVKKREGAEKTLEQRQQEAERHAALGLAIKAMDPVKHELCSKEENRAEMAATALEAVPLLIKDALKAQLGHEPTSEEFAEAFSTMTNDDVTPFFDLAYLKLEEELESIGKRYMKASKAQPTPTPAPERKPVVKPVVLSRPSVSTTKPAGKPMSVDDIFEAARIRANELAS
jgi:hypothetical protein